MVILLLPLDHNLLMDGLITIVKLRGYSHKMATHLLLGFVLQNYLILVDGCDYKDYYLYNKEVCFTGYASNVLEKG